MVPASASIDYERARRALGRAVRELRARRGLSQEALGFAAGLHRNVGAIERGEINPTIGTVLRLTVGLRVPTSELALVAERQSRACADQTPFQPVFGVPMR